MNVLNLLTAYKSVEINLSTGIRTGHMLAQHKFTKPAQGYTGDVVENGLFFRMDKTKDDEIVLADNANAYGAYWLHYTEELITHGLSSALKYFAVDFVTEGANKICYPRCIALYEGDTFTTNNFADLAQGTTLAQMKYGYVGTGGKLTLSATFPSFAQGTTYVGPVFKVAASTLPDGTPAAQCVVMNTMDTIVGA